LQIPNLSSLILHHDWQAPVAGLDTVPDDEEPPVAIVFWSFRIMLATGFAMMAIGIWASVQRLRGKLYQDRWLHRALLPMGCSGYIAVLAGWITTEVGRQPYVIYGLMRTTDAISPIDAPAVEASLLAFIVVYFFVFGAGTFYILRMMGKTPGADNPQLQDGPVRSAGLTPAQQVNSD